MEPNLLNRRRRFTLLGAFVAASLTVGVYASMRSSAGARAPQAVRQKIDAEAPEGIRIRVEVLNATTVRGLARRATMHLRDRGFDVVETGTARERAESTVVIDRSQNPEWAKLVADALGGARVESRPDSSRYLDVTVILGASWRPPGKPFYP